MAMTREEEKELRLNSSIGTLLGSLSSRDDLKKPIPPKEEAEEEQSDGEDAKGGPPKPKDEEESQALDFFTSGDPDYEEDDPDWVVEEKKYLIEEFGKRVVTLSFDNRDRFLYTCEICNIEFNTRAILTSHCNGMKHLKKKNLLDRKLQGKDVPTSFKLSKSDNKKKDKPSHPTHPNKRKAEDSSSEAKKKWQSNKDYRYGNGQDQQQQQQQQQHQQQQQQQIPPGFFPPNLHGPPPGFPGGPPPPGYGPWGTQNMYNTPPPAVDDKNNQKNSLAGGDTGSLLQKLADCSVKNEKDSELAINVVIALMKSLKDFNHKRGETKYIEVLTEADMTFRQLKTLKPSSSESNGPPADSNENNKNSFTDNTNSSSAGVSDFAQETVAPVSQDSSYSDNSQYYGSQNNTPSNNYSYGTNSNYSSPAPTGVPAPEGFNPSGTNQGYPSHQGYPAQGPPGGFDGSSYSNQGYYGQGPNAGGYPYPGVSYPPMDGGTQTPSTKEKQSPKKASGNATQSYGSILAPPPPPPPPPGTTSSTDESAPDLSNYGYAPGYAMGYYNVPPPPSYNQQY